MKLTNEQAAVLRKIIKRSRLAVWLVVDRNGMVHDRANHYRFMKTRDAVDAVYEHMTDYKDCRLTKKDIKIFETLLKTVGGA